MKNNFDFVKYYSDIWLKKEIKNHIVRNERELCRKTLNKKFIKNKL